MGAAQKSAMAKTFSALRSLWRGGESAPENAAETVNVDTAPPAETAPPEPDIIAAELLWGAGRERPGDAGFDAKLLAPLGLNEESKLAIFGAGLGAVCESAAEAGAEVTAFEWRGAWGAQAESFLRQRGLRERVALQSLDLAAPKAPESLFNAACIIDRLGEAKAQTRLLKCLARALTPSGLAVIVESVGEDAEPESLMDDPPDGPPGVEAWREKIARAGLEIVSSDEVSGQAIVAAYAAHDAVLARTACFAKRHQGSAAAAEVLEMARDALETSQKRLKALERGDLGVYRFLAAKSASPG